MARVLLATHDDALRARVLEPLTRAGTPVASMHDWSSLLRAVVQEQAGLVLVDGSLPDLNAELLRELANATDPSPSLRVLGEPAPPLVRVSLASVPALTRRKIQPVMSPDERKELRLLGLGREAPELLSRVAASGNAVILEGERGTGKKRIARLLHRLSDLPGPFLEVDGERLPSLGAEPGTLYVRAPSSRISEQLKTLQRQVGRGGEGGSWRLVAPSRKRVAGAAHGWHMLRLKPLRERPQELRPLTQLYLDRHARRLGLPRRRLDRALWAMLRKHRWPENALELEGFVVQLLTTQTDAVIRASGLHRELDEQLTPGPPDDIGDEARGFEQVVEQRLRSLVDAVDEDTGVALHGLVIDATERALLRLVLARTGGNQKAAAELLGVARNTLRAKALKLGVIEARVAEGAE